MTSSSLVSGWNHKPAGHVGVLTASVDKGGPMTEPAGINMNKDLVTAIGGDVTDFSSAVGTMAGYDAGDGLTAGHFGGVQGASDAGGLVLSTLTALSGSAKKAATFLDNAQTAIKASVAATSETDEDAQWGINKAGKGV